MKCTLFLNDRVSTHLMQVLNGFALLETQGILRIVYRKWDDTGLCKDNLLKVNINDRWDLIYDLNDGYYNNHESNVAAIINYERLLDNCDFLFKRSCCEKINKEIKGGGKIYPLGLNYYVVEPSLKVNSNLYNNNLVDNLRLSIKKSKIFKFNRSNFYNHSIDKISHLPFFNSQSIMFMTRLWEPNLHDKNEELNEFRAQCIRLCRREFGDSFFGGVIRNSISEKFYKDIIIDDPRVTERRCYLELVKKSSICITTTGLHNSIGWKFGEYVAMSRAIVSEPLKYSVPGNFEEGTNYLSFEDAHTCIEKVSELYLDRTKTLEMMRKNYEYYNSYLKPDILVLNTFSHFLYE